jgi:RNA polymerase sigma-70 factor (ECF subfamily)
LLAAHVAGEQYAFEELFYRHHRQLYRLAQITSRNPEDAADALQDAMLSAHRSAPRFRHPTSVLEEDVYNVGDPTPRVDTAIVVERALLRLPVEQRAAVVAVDMQGYSVAETARMLGIAEGTVKSRCSRARAKLAEALEYFNAGAAAAAERGMEP